MSPTEEIEMTYQTVDELDPALAEALLRWTLSLADTKHRVGMRTSEWINGTPALEGAVGAAAITQDELGHARSYFSMLRDFPGAPDAIGFENDLEARDVYYNPRQLDTPWASWLDVIAVNVLLDRALALAVEATRDSAFGPLGQRTAKILQEEGFHRIFGESWLARLARQDAKVKRRLKESLDRFWTTTLAWFGPDDDPMSALLFDHRILNARPAEMRQRWLDEVGALLTKHNLSLEVAKVDWARWDSAHRDVP